ncbi:MAG: fumarylacetoacetate hydrolase family protein [Candidatus Competibacterales bacterium]
MGRDGDRDYRLDRYLDPVAALPADGYRATLVGRAWLPGDPSGPAVVTLRPEGVVDISRAFPTVAHLLATADPAAAVRGAAGRRLGSLAEVLSHSHWQRRSPAAVHLLAPVDLQALKACGVTFVASMLERVIEERAAGQPDRAAAIRAELQGVVGGDLANVVPGGPRAQALKEALQARGIWSQYLEVGIGPYAEVFTKAQPLSAVGSGAQVGLHPESHWNNPEPEVVLVVNPRGGLVGATLGNDVNLRDFEGRSALLLGKAKDNNASCALGPFIRLFDDRFGLDDLRHCRVTLQVEGRDGFNLTDTCQLGTISRDLESLVSQTINANHQYPDGLVLFTGTPFTPLQDRDGPGLGFTHHMDDVVTIAASWLGTLANTVTTSNCAPPWTWGMGALMHNLAARGLLGGNGPGPEELP